MARRDNEEAGTQCGRPMCKVPKHSAGISIYFWGVGGQEGHKNKHKSNHFFLFIRHKNKIELGATNI